MTLHFGHTDPDKLTDMTGRYCGVDDDTFGAVLLAFDVGRLRDWPRQRTHFAIGHNIDGWRPVVEIQSFDPYDPAEDDPGCLEVVHASVEPVSDGPKALLPLNLRRDKNVKYYEHIRKTLDTKKQAPFRIGGSGLQRVGVAPPSAPTIGLTKKSITRALDLVSDAVRSKERTSELTDWYRLPRPKDAPEPRGRTARPPRELAELAKIYVHFSEANPETAIKAITASFGRQPTYWSGLMAHVADAGYIEDRTPGMAGGRLSQRAQDELNAHVRNA